jgi:hypothetical protein
MTVRADATHTPHVVVGGSMETLASMTLEEARERFPPIWTIYDHPRDFPNHFVVRRWFGECPEPDPALCDSLEAARILIGRSGGSLRLNRAPTDDPSIIESWL